MACCAALKQVSLMIPLTLRCASLSPDPDFIEEQAFRPILILSKSLIAVLGRSVTKIPGHITEIGQSRAFTVDEHGELSVLALNDISHTDGCPPVSFTIPKTASGQYKLVIRMDTDCQIRPDPPRVGRTRSRRSVRATVSHAAPRPRQRPARPNYAGVNRNRYRPARRTHSQAINHVEHVLSAHSPVDGTVRTEVELTVTPKDSSGDAQVSTRCPTIGDADAMQVDRDAEQVTDERDWTKVQAHADERGITVQLGESHAVARMLYGLRHELGSARVVCQQASMWHFDGAHGTSTARMASGTCSPLPSTSRTAIHH